ncbi:hypothetical protein EC988_002647 [Linderina pennispora]|nr:hypothetical protein EC988_002647 [Linderina pennispora]
MYVIRLRFQGGTVMAFRIDSQGTLIFVKGFFPPHPIINDDMGNSSEQLYINRVFRVVPLNGLPEFADQLRRELQSLLLLRVAAALSRCSYQRLGKRCQMGQWHVHQSQLCVVGEWWEGARHRQIVAVAKWEDWNLRLYFGPKHPTASDHTATGPWVASFPPATELKDAASQGKKGFEERLLKVLINAM